MNDQSTIWMPFLEGDTLGQTGNEGGQVIRDEEDETGARITLEQNCLRAPHAITAVIYDWLLHTRFIADEPTAISEYEKMRADLGTILASMRDESYLDDPSTLENAVSAFIERYP